MDIIDANPTCGCMSRFFAHSDAACARTPGHTGRHRATSGGEWDDDMAVWPTPRKAVDYLRSERDAYAKQVETLTKERDLARSELDLCTGRLQTAVDAVAESRREAALLRTSLDATQDDLEQVRHAADEWAVAARESSPKKNRVETWFDALPPVQCPHSKAKQVGSSSFVVRRCKLADGHDGMCEPA